MTVRSVTHQDRDQWLRMLCELYPHTTEADHTGPVDAFLAGTPHVEQLPDAVFVDEMDGRLCGFVELSIRRYAEGCTGPTPCVESWFVDAGDRGQGVGRALMDRAKAWAAEKGYRELASNADLSNAESHAAHRAAGFQEVERTVHFRMDLTRR